MENKAVQVIDGQIAEINDKILNTKIAMADLILNIHFTDFKKTPTTNELFLLFDQMDKLPKLIVQYNENKSRLVSSFIEGSQTALILFVSRSDNSA